MVNTPKQIHIGLTFRNTEATDALKTYATDKLQHCLQKFAHQDLEVHAVLQVEKNRQIAEVSFNMDGLSFNAKEQNNDMYASIDLLCDTITQQLRKHKDKLTKKH